MLLIYHMRIITTGTTAQGLSSHPSVNSIHVTEFKFVRTCVIYLRVRAVSELLNFGVILIYRCTHASLPKY